MKTLTTIVAAMLVAIATYGQPSTGESSLSAEISKAKLRAPQSANAITTPVGYLTTTLVLGPTVDSPSWPTFAANLLLDAKNGAVSNHSAAITGPTDYWVCNNGKIGWQNFVYSTGASMWDGVLNPPVLYTNQLGRIVQGLVQGWSTDGTDSISLSSVTVYSQSSDTDGTTGNALGDSVSLAGRIYGTYAIGIKADGSVVNSGSGLQKVARIMFIADMKLFNGGGTQAGLDEVRVWIQSQNNFTYSCWASFTSAVDNLDSAVSLNGYSTNRPSLNFTRTSVNVTNGEFGRLYFIQMAPTVVGPYVNVAPVNDTQGVQVSAPPANVTNRFYRVFAP